LGEASNAVRRSSWPPDTLRTGARPACRQAGSPCPAAVHMGPMKITAYMNLLPELSNLDARSRTVSLVDRGWALEIYPDMTLANSAVGGGEATYEVMAEIPDGSAFEDRGGKDQTEGRGDLRRGPVRQLPAAYVASDGLGVMGSHGYVGIRLAPATVYSTHREWKEAFQPVVARRGATQNHQTNLHQLMGSTQRVAVGTEG
jgi:hypothetical protein